MPKSNGQHGQHGHHDQSGQSGRYAETRGAGPSAVRGAATRDRLLAAARTLIARDGWGNVTTRAVAEEAEANPGLVHYHFGTVDELRRSAVRQLLDHIIDVSLADMTSQDDVMGGLGTALDRLAAQEREDPDTVTVLLEGYLATLRDERLRADFREMLERTREAIIPLLSRTTARRDARAVTALLLAAIDGAYLHRMVDPDLRLTDVLAPLAELVQPAADGTPDAPPADPADPGER